MKKVIANQQLVLLHEFLFPFKLHFISDMTQKKWLAQVLHTVFLVLASHNEQETEPTTGALPGHDNARFMKWIPLIIVCTYAYHFREGTGEKRLSIEE